MKTILYNIITYPLMFILWEINPWHGFVNGFMTGIIIAILVSALLDLFPQLDNKYLCLQK